ncbi:hypothetical protein K435DRAFT_820512 [Dendrothele bispora CBS 962.96]|uniref:Ubiquitin 3 binding protein But2 C-terminal domain-containing protein n=1 Tax=Dendrothele bispora (strain CBS 962.96) TaxID=1314807 RepID=A0A4S8LSB2_DENBC|nr:hypothetical protein K435DRAFT_820512 [Dendrothele bispora CBS 962.96]
MYAQLSRGSSSSLEDDDTLADPVLHTGKREKFDRLLLWACMTVTAISLILSTFVLSSNSTSSMRPFNKQDVIHRPNPYANLDRLYKANPSLLLDRKPFPSIYSYAHVVLQIPSSDPRRVYLPEDERSYSSREGYIYTDDRHVLITPEISTIIQFRNQDYGMENCTLEPTIPSLGNSPVDLDSSVRIDHLSIVEIWMLDNTREISRYDPVSWKHAPLRKTLLASISVSGEVWNEQKFHFRCPSNGFSTFEFACSKLSPNCHIDFWQRKSTPPNGIYIVQHDSLSIV